MQKQSAKWYLSIPMNIGIPLILLFIAAPLHAVDPPRRINALYSSLDPTSVSQHLALYHLYPSSKEGQQALRRAWQLLNTQPTGGYENISLPKRGIEAVVALVNKHPMDAPLQLSDDELGMIDRISSHLANRRLRGFGALNEQTVLSLPPEEIDLGRGLFLSQMGETPEALQSVRSYEAMLDLMALQIRARLKPESRPEDKIRELNRFVFEEMNFRFPPHSVYAKDIDLYTFLPSVLDTRRGVCLGVSVLYLCLAQRLDVPMEIVTPPGHIYVRYRDKIQEINIETTLRGVHVDSREYLSIDTRQLQERDLRETIGFTHINAASVYLQTQQYDKALATYNKALPYLPQDKHLHQLMGITYALSGNEEKARALLEPIRDWLPEEAVSKDTLIEDYLNGKTDASGLGVIFLNVDETSDSLNTKRKALKECLEKFPEFRSGWLQLATTALQMHRVGEGLEYLERYHQLHQDNVSAEYFLSVVYAERLNFNKAWEHLHNTEKLLAARDHQPKAMKTHRRQLALRCPE